MGTWQGWFGICLFKKWLTRLSNLFFQSKHIYDNRYNQIDIVAVTQLPRIREWSTLRFPS
jgi:hypothetical protein